MDEVLREIGGLLLGALLYGIMAVAFLGGVGAFG